MQNSFIKWYYDSCHDCVFWKNLSKIVKFLYSHFNIEPGRKHFWCIIIYYFKKGKNATEMQKKKK